MSNIRTAVAVFAATGLAAFGAMAVSGGVANAATDLSITGCSIDSGLLGPSDAPACGAADGTIYNPTQIKVSVTGSFFQVFGGGPHIPLAVVVRYTLACSVDGHWKIAHEHFFATGAPHGGNTQVVNLQHDVESPAPNSCEVRNLSASAGITLGGLSPHPAPHFTFGVQATGDNGIPGTIWAQYPKNSVGSGSTVCADDTANGDASTAIQAFQCENDLADAWLMTTDGQLVHNGDCMTQTGNGVSLVHCQAHPKAGSNQVWDFHGTSETAGWLTNTNGNGCLTAPSSEKIDGVQLKVLNCSGGLGQLWKVPAATSR